VHCGSNVRHDAGCIWCARGVELMRGGVLLLCASVVAVACASVAAVAAAMLVVVAGGDGASADGPGGTDTAPQPPSFALCIHLPPYAPSSGLLTRRPLACVPPCSPVVC
jgi:hypothetical protein